jgi:cytochrome c5
VARGYREGKGRGIRDGHDGGSIMKQHACETARLWQSIVAGVLLVLAGAAPGADRTGREVVEAVCIQCHGPGKDGAPRIGNAYEWAQHARLGLTQLTQNAISGVRKMPAHGGQASLTDLEMSRGIVFMISNGNAKDPDRPYATPNRWSGELIVGEVCGNCHKAGKDGAPKIGEAEQWLPRLKGGIDRVVDSAIRGHGNMLSRGGMAGLSDVEIKAAVSYMVSRVNVPRQN